MRRVDVHAGGGAVPVGGEAEDAAELAHGPKLLAVDDQQSALEVEVAAVDLDVLPALGEVELYAVKRALRVREAGDVGELGQGHAHLAVYDAAVSAVRAVYVEGGKCAAVGFHSRLSRFRGWLGRFRGVVRLKERQVPYGRRIHRIGLSAGPEGTARRQAQHSQRDKYYDIVFCSLGHFAPQFILPCARLNGHADIKNRFLQ